MGRFHLSSDAYVIDKVFGSPESELSTGQLMRINTLFPSAKDEQGQTKGGVVLLRLVRKNSSVAADETLKLRVSYEDRCGIPDFSELSVQPGLPGRSIGSSDFSSRTRVCARLCCWLDMPLFFTSG